MKEKVLISETSSKIVASAIELFNIHGYAGTSISDIAKKAQLSKGILYHYFGNKDELYLYCAKLCIDQYMQYLQCHLQNPTQNADMITENIKLRLQFFDDHPQYRAFFNFIISRKPDHLASELIKIRQTLANSNTKRLKEITSNMKFGRGITQDDIIAFTVIMQNSFSFLLQDSTDADKKEQKIEAAVRLTKIFINGLKEDLE